MREDGGQDLHNPRETHDFEESGIHFETGNENYKGFLLFSRYLAVKLEPVSNLGSEVSADGCFLSWKPVFDLCCAFHVVF